jgi:hypothetical protein
MAVFETCRRSFAPAFLIRLACPFGGERITVTTEMEY